jgi:hypothetical protein
MTITTARSAAARPPGRTPNLLGELADAMACFQTAMNSLGLGQAVTVFTQSDFGRTFAPNETFGTDHAWGNHHLVMGGAVKGKKTYGAYPTLVLGGPDDVGVEEWELQGRWIPTSSVDLRAGLHAPHQRPVAAVQPHARAGERGLGRGAGVREGVDHVDRPSGSLARGGQQCVGHLHRVGGADHHQARHALRRPPAASNAISEPMLWPTSAACARRRRRAASTQSARPRRRPAAGRRCGRGPAGPPPAPQAMVRAQRASRSRRCGRAARRARTRRRAGPGSKGLPPV